MESKRLPNKALLKINNESLIEHLLVRLNKNKNEKELLLCTTKRIADDHLIKICKKNNIKFFRGSNSFEDDSKQVDNEIITEEDYEEKIEEIQKKHLHAVKEKALLKLEKDKLHKKVSDIQR